jgi:NTE family protein
MDITLALSGGGVKGFAHIGALRILEREGFRIRAIAGTSAGGLVSALYASGHTADEMETRLRSIDQGNLFSRMHGDGPSLLGFSGASAILKELLGERTFDDLHIPLAITATDLTTGTPLTIKSGRLIDAVLATSAAPGVFPAQRIDGHVIVDGGVTNPIPVAVVRALYPQAPVLAVVLSPPLGWQKDAGMNSKESIPVLMTNLPLVYRLAGRLRLTQAFNLFVNSMDLTGLVLMDKQLQLERPDVVIRPHLGLIGLVDHVDIPTLIKCGEEATLTALPEIRRVTKWPYRIWRQMLVNKSTR